MEKYDLAHWRAVPDRSRGTWARPAAKFKREFAGYINRARDLTATDKLVGRLLVDYYNEKYGCAWPSTKTFRLLPGRQYASARSRPTAGLSSICPYFFRKWARVWKTAIWAST